MDPTNSFCKKCVQEIDFGIYLHKPVFWVIILRVKNSVILYPCVKSGSGSDPAEDSDPQPCLNLIRI